MERVARHVLVTGSVQGGAFRHYTKTLARELGLAGWVRNLPDGRVEVWAEGEAARVDELVAWLRRGPPAARVERVDAREVAAEGHARFRIE